MLKVELEGTDSTKSAAVLAACAEALGELRGKAAEEMEAAVVDKRVGIVIEHLFVIFIRFLAVPMATDDDISERPHLQTA
ncbi:hypothetical protein [Adlercreutzia sp.]|uniref:hypothetical protein n=1 Tax=Adlercreutzia sp. TaxID=1872387 RepID=UPI003A94BDEF